MTSRPANDCAHERRPGTTVCLYCRADARAVVRKRRQHGILRLASYAGIAAAIVVGAATALGGFRGSADADDTTVATAEDHGTRVLFAAEQAVEPRPAPARTSSPVVPPGRTPLTGGIYAERAGDTVTVHFDTREARTRRSDKFEHVVRETLPLILGEPAQRALEKVVPGTLVAPGKLVASSAAPLRLPVGDGRAVVVTPGSRMGQDGPLVVTYRAVLDAASPSPTS